MKIIVGLGNPGNEYRTTRHNVGFMILDELAQHWKSGFWKNRFDAEISEYRHNSELILLVKPQTYMNLSGVSIAQIMRFYKITPVDLIVIYDDLDLHPGQIRLRTKGGAGGHKGVQSLLFHLNTADFPRIRVGIGRPPDGWNTADYVLSVFAQNEHLLINESINTVVAAIDYIVKSGFTKAMNKFNLSAKPDNTAK